MKKLTIILMLICLNLNAIKKGDMIITDDTYYFVSEKSYYHSITDSNRKINDQYESSLTKELAQFSHDILMCGFIYKGKKGYNIYSLLEGTKIKVLKVKYHSSFAIVSILNVDSIDNKLKLMTKLKNID